MQKILNLSGAANAIILDSQDTVAKLLEFRAWLQDFENVWNELLDERGVAHSDQEIIDFFDHLADKDPYPYSNDDSITGLTLMQANCVNVTRVITYETGDPDDMYYVQELKMKRGDSETNVQIQAFKSWDSTEQQYVIGCQFYCNNQYIDDPEDFILGNVSVDGISLLNISANLNDALDANTFIQDITNVLKNPNSFDNTITKWASKANVSESMANAISDAIHNIDGSVGSVATWIQSLYSNMSDTTDSDEDLTFSTNNFFVKAAFSTVVHAVLAAIPTVLGTICLVIGKVAGAIGMAVSALFSFLSSAWDKVSNPTIAIKTGGREYYDYLPVPILQSTKAAGSLHFNSTLRRNISLNTPIATFRIFKNATGPTYWEAFLKPAIDGSYWGWNPDYPQKQYPDSTKWADYTGILGLNNLLTKIGIQDDDISSVLIADLPDERTQATRMFQSLFVFFIAFCEHVQCDETEPAVHFRDAWTAMKNNPTVQTVSRVFCLWRKNMIAFLDDADTPTFHRYWYDATYTPVLHQTYTEPTFTWADIFNVLIPAIRNIATVDSYYPDTTMFFDQFQGDAESFDYITVNETIEQESTSNISYCMYCPEPIQQANSCFAVPKYTRAGLLANIITATVAIAVTAAVAIVAVVKYKQWARTKAISATNKLNNLKAENDRVQSDASISAADKAKSSKAYLKQVRKYNRTSWMWGGGSYNAVNGWVDYAESSGADLSSADLTSSLPSSSELRYSMDSTTDVNATVLDSAQQSTSDYQTLSGQLSNVSSQSSNEFNALRTLISGQ